MQLGGILGQLEWRESGRKKVGSNGICYCFIRFQHLVWVLALPAVVANDDVGLVLVGLLCPTAVNPADSVLFIWQSSKIL